MQYCDFYGNLALFLIYQQEIIFLFKTLEWMKRHFKNLKIFLFYTYCCINTCDTNLQFVLNVLTFCCVLTLASDPAPGSCSLEPHQQNRGENGKG